MTITVYGTPAPQGSKSFKGIHGGKAILVESSKAVKPWRQAVVAAALDACETQCREKGAHSPCVSGPVSVQMIFTMPKPKSAPKRCVTHPDKKPDIDKLCRSTLDSLVTTGVIEDDSRVVELNASKVFPGEGPGSLRVPGAVICVAEITHA